MPILRLRAVIVLAALWATLFTPQIALVLAEDPVSTAEKTGTPPPADTGLRALADHIVKCTVGITCRKGDYQAYTGTGAVITADGYILTSTTVVPDGSEKIEVTFSGFVVRPATIVEANEPLETTIIKVDASDLPSLPLARELPDVGDRAYTASNANSVLRSSGVASFSAGLVSGLYRVENLGGESLYSGMAIETTAAVNPGTDGGPIVNDAGQICAVISLNVSPARWQGVGVPSKTLLEQLETLKSDKLKLSFDPLPTRPTAPNAAASLARHASDLAPSLVGIQVQRKFAPEILPRAPWDDFRQTIEGWDQKSLPERTRHIQQFFELTRVIEANQMLRRPKQVATGLIVSAEGHILTSDFNVSEDAVFLDKKTSAPREFKLTEKLDELFKDPEYGYERTGNSVEKITVVLADGSQHEAVVLGRHVPLGVALLKIEATGLPAYDMAVRAGPPRLGVAVGLIGISEGSDHPGARFTLNNGIISAERRSRGLRCQTDALLNYGNSGGPLLDEGGAFIGLATTPIEPRTVIGRLFRGQELNAWSMAPNSGVSLIARGDKIAEALERLKAGESTLVVPGPFLGVGPDPNRVLGAQVIVGAVSADSPASKAGLKTGDQLMTINGQELNNWNDLTEHLMEFKPGDKVEILVKRPGINKKLSINGKSVSNEAELQALLDSLKPGEKFEGTMVSEDTRLMSIELGVRK